MNDWLQEWKSESSLKQRMRELFIWHREGSIGARFIIVPKVPKVMKCQMSNVMKWQMS